MHAKNVAVQMRPTLRFCVRASCDTVTFHHREVCTPHTDAHWPHVVVVVVAQTKIYKHSQRLDLNSAAVSIRSVCVSICVLCFKIEEREIQMALAAPALNFADAAAMIFFVTKKRTEEMSKKGTDDRIHTARGTFIIRKRLLTGQHSAFDAFHGP